MAERPIKAPPNNSIVRNQGGQVSAKRPGPKVPDQPIARARSDSIVRPINTTQGPLATPGGLEAPIAQPPGTLTSPPPSASDVTLTQKLPDGSEKTEKSPPGAENPLLEQQQEIEMSKEVEGLSVKEFDSMMEDSMKHLTQADRDDPIKARKQKEDVKRQIQSFGNYPGKGDPNAPNPPIRAGRMNFNPFTGNFADTGKPSFIKFSGIDMQKLKREFYATGGKGKDASKG